MSSETGLPHSVPSFYEGETRWCAVFRGAYLRGEGGEGRGEESRREKRRRGERERRLQREGRGKEKREEGEGKREISWLLTPFSFNQDLLVFTLQTVFWFEF